MTNPRMIIFGGSGFIGRWVSQLANIAGWDVTSLGSAAIDLTKEIDSSLISKIVRNGDVVVHAAAIAPTRSVDDLSRNLVMTKNLAAALSPLTGLDVVLISSDAVYGSSSGVVNEDSPCNPDSLHGVMSLGRELVTAEMHPSSLTILRPVPVYGVDDTHNSYGPNKMAREAVSSGRISIFGAGSATRDHVSVQDVARIVVDAASRRGGGVFNIASGQSFSFSKVADLIASSSSNKVRLEHVGEEAMPTFRTMDISLMLRSFPNHSPTSLEFGIEALVHDLENLNGN